MLTPSVPLVPAGAPFEKDRALAGEGPAIHSAYVSFATFREYSCDDFNGADRKARPVAVSSYQERLMETLKDVPTS